MNKLYKDITEQVDYWKRAYEIEHDRRLKEQERNRNEFRDKFFDTLFVCVIVVTITLCIGAYNDYLLWLAAH